MTVLFKNAKIFQILASMNAEVVAAAEGRTIGCSSKIAFAQSP